MKNVIGITGPTGSGKSIAVAAAKELGFAVIDCDEIVHNCLNNDTLCINAVAQAFGSDCITNGAVNRKILAARAFKDDESTLLLNNTVLPFAVTDILKRLALTKENNVLLDAPTLFESGLDEVCNQTVAVISEKDLRLNRIIQRDGITKEAALLRMSAGKDDTFYYKNAGAVIENNGTAKEFINKFTEILKDITEE